MSKRNSKRMDKSEVELENMEPNLPAESSSESDSSSSSEDEKPSHKKLSSAKSRRNIDPKSQDPKEVDRGVKIGSLLYAASRGDGEAVTKILKEGVVSINDGDYDKRTALHIAASEGHFELVKLLVEDGVDVNSRDRWGGTPLDDAIRHSHDSIAVYLKAHGATNGSTNFGKELLNAAATGDIATVRKLVEGGISLDSVDYDKRTALHVAVAERQQEVVEYLLSKGANPNAMDRFGGTPITEANRNGVRIGEDDIKDLLNQHSGEHKPTWSWKILHPFVFVIAGFQILFFILFAIFLEYAPGQVNGKFPAEDGFPDVYEYYPFYMDVHVMIFIGFGFLMTFLRKYGYMAIGLNFLLGCLCIQWYLIVGQFWEYILEGHWVKIPININRLIKADFSAGAVLITFGALLGKTSPVQMCLLAMFEVFIYSANEAIGLKLAVADIGGSMVIHMFGAFFGLAASIVLTPRGARGNKDNGAVYRSDLFSMIGTIFLWMYWPSFNGALGTGATQHRAIVNTVLSLSASCVSAFLFSFIIRGERRFNMVDIQNATLAGGVAMGTCADTIIHPAIALGIGFIAGFISVFGFAKLQPIIEQKFGIHDTCGVNNLHGMPSLFGAFCGVASAAWANSRFYGPQLFTIFPEREDGRGAQSQALYQLAYIAITLGISIVGGILTGIIVKYIAPASKYFLDDEFWEVPELELPYYFDKRGEIIRIDEAISERVGQQASVDDSKEKETLANRVMELETKMAALRSTFNRASKRFAASPLTSPSTSNVSVSGNGDQAQALLLQSLTQAVQLLAAQNEAKNK